MLLDKLVKELDELLLPSDFSDYCPNGLQVEGKKEVKRVGFAVSASLEAIQEAAKRGVDALIVHHGIFWNKDPYPLVGPKKERIAELMRYEMSLIAYHLPLDAHQELGNNYKAALEMGWKDLSAFRNLGVKAFLNPIDVATFQKQLETYYDHPAHTALFGKEEIKVVALVSGGAHKMIDAAAEEGADAFVTGSFDEMIWDSAKERGIHFFALGHFATERVGVKALMAYLRKNQELECEWIDLYNPF